jgi:hypothetical protein
MLFLASLLFFITIALNTSPIPHSWIRFLNVYQRPVVYRRGLSILPVGSFFSSLSEDWTRPHGGATALFNRDEGDKTEAIPVVI